MLSTVGIPQRCCFDSAVNPCNFLQVSVNTLHLLLCLKQNATVKSLVWESLFKESLTHANDSQNLKRRDLYPDLAISATSSCLEPVQWKKNNCVLQKTCTDTAHITHNTYKSTKHTELIHREVQQVSKLTVVLKSEPCSSYMSFKGFFLVTISYSINEVLKYKCTYVQMWNKGALTHFQCYCQILKAH